MRDRTAHPTVVVTDADRGSAVAIIRSLGRRGYRVIAADETRRSLGFRSRYTSRSAVYPSPAQSPDAFVAWMLELVGRDTVDLVIPVTDFTIQPLAAARSRFDGLTRLALPPADALRVVTDKLQTLEVAARLGVPVPKTHLVHTAHEAAQHAEELGWPLVLKPRMSKHLVDGVGIQSFSVTYATSPRELEEAMQRFAGRCGVLLQEYVRGSGCGVELLLCDGRPLAAFAHRRLREVPPTGGVSSFRQSVPLDERLYDYSLRLLRDLRWTGLAMVEFKVTPARTALMEINGRVWGSLPLAVSSGVDFPALLATLYLVGEHAIVPQLGTQYSVGVHSRNLLREIAWIGSVLTHRHGSPTLPMPRRREALRACLSLLNPRYKNDLFTMDDPVPGLLEIPTIVRQVWSKTLGNNRHNGRGYTLRVLTYHRVADGRDTPTLNPRLVSATPAVFAQQMAYLARRYHVVSLADVVAAIRNAAPLPRRAVLITFDDAYVDFADTAWPILQRYGLPATLSVATAYASDPARRFWWDRVHSALVHTTQSELCDDRIGALPLATPQARQVAFVRIRQRVVALRHEAAMALVDDVCAGLGGEPPAPATVLTWDQLRALAQQGVSLCAHTRTHPLLTRVSLDQARDEIAGSLRDLAREVPGVVPAFSYPDGAHDDAVVELLRQEGVVVALTQTDGHSDLRSADPLRLSRTNITPRTSPLVFSLRLLPWVARMDRWRHRK